MARPRVPSSGLLWRVASGRQRLPYRYPEIIDGFTALLEQHRAYRQAVQELPADPPHELWCATATADGQAETRIAAVVDDIDRMVAARIAQSPPPPAVGPVPIHPESIGQIYSRIAHLWLREPGSIDQPRTCTLLAVLVAYDELRTDLACGARRLPTPRPPPQERG